jgi:uncharacterized pyridoxamine 5'-phosphate oxidase family protein
MSWQEALKERQKIILATSSMVGKPRAIVVVSLGRVDEKLLIGACLMGKSLENIKENNKVSIVTFGENGYYRIDGLATIFNAGNYLDIAIKKSNPPLPKAAILIDIAEVVDLDKGVKVV